MRLDAVLVVTKWKLKVLLGVYDRIEFGLTMNLRTVSPSNLSLANHVSQANK